MLHQQQQKKKNFNPNCYSQMPSFTEFFSSLFNWKGKIQSKQPSVQIKSNFSGKPMPSISYLSASSPSSSSTNTLPTSKSSTTSAIQPQQQETSLIVEEKISALRILFEDLKKEDVSQEEDDSDENTLELRAIMKLATQLQTQIENDLTMLVIFYKLELSTKKVGILNGHLSKNSRLNFPCQLIPKSKPNRNNGRKKSSIIQKNLPTFTIGSSDI